MTDKNKIGQFLMLLIIVLLANCSKPDCTAPHPFDLRFFYFSNDKNIDYLNDRNIYEKLKISYINELNEKKYIKYSVLLGHDWQDFERFLYSRDLTAVAGTGITDFYFEFQDNIDTLYLDIESKPHPECEGYLYTFKEMRFNGLAVSSRNNHHGDLTYELFSND